jgi:hypothetical protein
MASLNRKKSVKHVLYMLLVLSGTVFGQPSVKPQVRESVGKITLHYDTSVLRIPGNSLPIGIEACPGNGSAVRTKGYLKGSGGWGRYKVEVAGGSYFNGKIHIKGNTDYKKGDSIRVDVYTRKWFLGKKDEHLLTEHIPYNYETGIQILTRGAFLKALGNHVDFGIRTSFDNAGFVDKWAPAGTNLQDFIFAPDGAHISKSKGDLKIDNNPLQISDDKVKLIARLAKYPEITDTLKIILDYVEHYQCAILSGGKGHELQVTAGIYPDTVIHAKLLNVKVLDNTTHKTTTYLVNTQGGSLSISSRGGNGMNGNSGSDGSSGLSGTSGSTSTDMQMVTASDGTMSTTTVIVQGPGGDGGPGGNGGNGDDGGRGYDGGSITVNYTADVQPYLNLIKAFSIPGSGGSGGRGGYGGQGGSGGSGNPSGNSGSQGSSGLSGSNGPAGKAGKVVFIPAP